MGQWITVGKVWLGLVNLIDVFGGGAVMFCHAGQLAVILDPCVSGYVWTEHEQHDAGIRGHSSSTVSPWSWRLNVLLSWCHKATDVLVHPAGIISSFTLLTNCTLWSIEFHFPIFPTFLIFCPFYPLSQTIGRRKKCCLATRMKLVNTVSNINSL